ncbi:hypothetical protein BC831DRAFT_473244 [Entophlyctis helioformis]|nr:hypothetical protein BC831DRAFT_473244 [Entophlyctis helioformis]
MAALINQALEAARLNHADSQEAGVGLQDAAFPISTRHIMGTVGGKAAQAIFMEFGNMLVLLVTQTGKIGSLSMVSLDAASAQMSGGPGAGGMASEPLTTVKSLLGPRDDVLLQACASHMLAQIHKANPSEMRQLLFGLSIVRAAGHDNGSNNDAFSADARQTFTGTPCSISV